MPEHIRALVVVLVVSSLVWWMARPAIVQIIPAQTFSRWRTLWYVTTLAWFLGQSFWLYAIFMLVVLLVAGKREPYVLGLYLLLLMAAPPSELRIPGFGVIDHLFVLSHPRLLALALLLPCAWRLSSRASTVRLFSSPVDLMVVGYLLLNSALAFREGNFTNDTRAALMLWVDFFLPYYVASRSLQDREDFRHALVGLALAGALLAALAAVEVLRNWKLYEGATAALGLHTFGAYKMRGSFIRPSVTVVDSIALGYCIVVAAGCFLYLQRMVENRTKRWLGWLGLGVGVLMSLSRGPWVGGLLVIFMFMLTSARPIKRLFQSGVVAVVLGTGLLVSPIGQDVVNLLPYVGQEEQENVDYRADLLTVSIPVVERNLLFGSSDFIYAPELQVMKQGEGIIDIVNSYLAVALYAGMVGLFLFAGMFLFSLLGLRRCIRRARQSKDDDREMLGRALFSSLVGVMFIIFTVSGVYIVPTMYFTLIGICSGYILWQQADDKAKRAGVKA